MQEAATTHSAEDVFEALWKAETAAVATLGGADIRLRAMHHAPEKDLTLFFATMKGDPKSIQLTANANVSVLVLERSGEMSSWSETEITGVAEILKDDAAKARARELLAERSPVVKNLVASGNDHILDWLVVKPRTVKYRVFGEVVQGLPPTVIQQGPQRRRSFGADVREAFRWARSWYYEMRLPFLTGTTLPVLIGLTVAYFAGGAFSFPLAAAVLLGAMFLHLGTNVLNDYFDHLSGNDEANTEFTRPFSGGSRMIQLGLISPVSVLVAGAAFLLAGSSIGVYLAMRAGPWLWAIGGVGMVCALLYSLPRFGLAGSGLGELIVGINFGPLMALGAYYVQTGTLAWEPVVASVPVALLIALVLFMNEFPDVRADSSVGKRTLVVRLGPKAAAWGYWVWSVAMVAGTVVAVALDVLPVEALAALSAVPFLVWGGVVVVRHAKDAKAVVPACAATVVAHVLAGCGIISGYFAAQWGRAQAGGPAALATLVVAVLFYLYSRRQKSAFERAKQTFVGASG